jgi:hypothetical protein
MRLVAAMSGRVGRVAVSEPGLPPIVRPVNYVFDERSQSAEEPDDPLERRWVRELLDLPDLEARLAAFARHTAATLELTSPMYAVIRSAGTGAQELSGLEAELREMRYGQQAKVMRAVVDGGALAPGVSVKEAAETFSALASPELYHLLTEGRGWGPRRYSRWLQGLVKSALLAG